jgi:transcriptional regulator with XRE-family HTH domain
MPQSTRRLVDQLAATSEEREANGEFLFEGAGCILSELRKQRGWTLDDVATRLNLTKSTVLQYEKDEVPLSDYAVARFAEVYEVDPEKLMYDCLAKVLPEMQDSPFGQLLHKIITKPSSQMFTPTAPFPVEPVPPELLEWARQTLDEKEILEEIESLQKNGGYQLESFIDELEMRANGK